MTTSKLVHLARSELRSASDTQEWTNKMPTAEHRIKLDPITTEIIREKLQSIPNLVEADLTRTAFSPLVYEYKDYSVGVVDSEGSIIALAQHGLPLFTASMISC